jgi:hypothetical protein
MPMFGALLIRIARRVVRLEDRWSSAIVALAALAGAWLWRFSGSETVVLGWGAVSFVGVPLIIDAQAANTALVIAIAAVRMARMADEFADGAPARTLTSAALFSALAFACLARSTPMLLTGLGLANLCALWLSARQSNGHGAIRAFWPQALALFLALLGFSIQGGDGVLQAGIATRASVFVSVIFSLAVLLHAGVVARISTDAPDSADPVPHSAQRETGVIGTALLLYHIPTPPVWLAGCGAVLALIWSIRALTALTGAMQRHAIGQSAAAMILLTAMVTDRSQGAPLTAALAWALGMLLLDRAPLLRLAGMLLLVGAPPLVGFGPLTLAFGALAQSGAGGVLALVIALCAYALLVAALCKSVFGLEPLGDALRGMARGTAALAQTPAVLIVLAHAFLLGLVPILAGRELTAVINNPLGLMLAAAAAIAGFFIWRLLDRNAVMDVFDQIDAGIDRLGAEARIMGGALERIRGGLRVAFIFLESDGALLWTCLLVLIALLIGRAPQP